MRVGVRGLQKQKQGITVRGLQKQKQGGTVRVWRNRNRVHMKRFVFGDNCALRIGPALRTGVLVQDDGEAA
jgi:hypothetical protein